MHRVPSRCCIFGIDDALIIGGLAAAGSTGGGLLSMFGQKSTNAQNALINQEQMDLSERQFLESTEFNQSQADQARTYDTAVMAEQERYNNEMFQNQANYNTTMAMQQQSYEQAMSNTAYQRSVADMKAAGLNPILGVASGGASTPSVAAPTASGLGISAPSSPSPTASGQLPHMIAMQNPMAGLGQAISQGLNTGANVIDTLNKLQVGQANVDNIKADTANKNAATAGIVAESANKALLPDLTKGQIDKLSQEIYNLGLVPGLTAAQIQQALGGAAAGFGSAQSSQASAKQIEAITEFLKTHDRLPGTTGTPSLTNPDYLQGASDSVKKFVRDLLANAANSGKNAADRINPSVPPGKGGGFWTGNPASPDWQRKYAPGGFGTYP